MDMNLLKTAKETYQALVQQVQAMQSKVQEMQHAVEAARQAQSEIQGCWQSIYMNLQAMNWNLSKEQCEPASLCRIILDRSNAIRSEHSLLQVQLTKIDNFRREHEQWTRRNSWKPPGSPFC